MHKFTCGPYTISLADSYPPMYYSYCQHADLVDANEREVASSISSLCYLSVSYGRNWPFLIVARHYSPGPQSGFYPGVLLVPETSLLLLGAGERLLAYALDVPNKLWEYDLPGGFCQWERAHDQIIMSSEGELAVWDIHGQKRWDFPVSPPWRYSLEGDMIYVYANEKQTALQCEHGIVIEGTAVPS